MTQSLREASVVGHSSDLLTRAIRDGVVLIILWVVVTSYNLFKPFHIDDAAHLLIAQWIAQHPLHPMSGVLNWSGLDEPIYRTNQPHLYFYGLALWGSVFGYSEPAMHAFQALASGTCIALFYRLASHCVGRAAVWATAMLVLSPAFIVEQNLMVDVPLLALWLAFFNFLIVDPDRPYQTRRYLGLSLVCGAALLVKYSSLVLLALIWGSLLIERRKAQAWTALVPLAVLLAWSLFNVADYGGIHLLERPTGVHHRLLAPVARAVAWILALGALTPVGLIVAGRFGEARRRLVPYYASLAAAFVLLFLGVGTGLVRDTWSDKLLWVVFMLSGFLALLPVLLDGATIRPAALLSGRPAPEILVRLYLLAWLVTTSAFYVLLAPFIASRHVLLILPAVLLVALLQRKLPLPAASKTFGLAATVIVSLGLCVVDWQFAQFFRGEAEAIGAAYVKPGRTVWASGHWGWQWYAGLAGMKELDVRAEAVRPGDIIAVADADAQPIQKPLHLTPVWEMAQTTSLPVLFCTARSSRFYGSNQTNAPWSLSRTCGSRISVYQVEE